MGSSAKKKKEKKKDFQKQKLKVGKTKSKASNFTDTSFGSRAITMDRPTCLSEALDQLDLFKHTLSLASSCKSPIQRREALAHLTHRMEQTVHYNTLGTQELMTRLLPLISDSATPVRDQLLKLFKTLPDVEVRHSVEEALMFIRAGMTHISADISNDSLGFMEWLLDVADGEVVRCAGGWVKTLNTFVAATGWAITSSKDGWSSGSRSASRAKDAQIYARQMTTLSRFLEAGLKPEDFVRLTESDQDNLARIPQDLNSFEHLNISGSSPDEEGVMYDDREDRQRIFQQRGYEEAILKGVEKAKKEGGATGRAAVQLDQVIRVNMADYESSMAIDMQELRELW